MKKIILATFSILSISSLLAQVGIGTHTPHNSAALELSSSNKGFLPSRIALTSTSDVTSISSPATGLLVYNTTTSALSSNNVFPGYYFYNGLKWSRLNDNDPSSPFLASASVNDAGSSKTLDIYRPGSLGLGFPQSIASIPSAKLDVNGNALFRSGGLTSNQLLFSLSGGSKFKHSIRTRHNSGQSNGNAIDFYLWQHGDDENTIGSKHIMTLDAIGNVGIGVTNPLSNLHINSSIISSNTINANANVLQFSRPTNNNIKWGNIAKFNLGSFSTGGQSDTRLDLELSSTDHNTFNTTMTWLSNGNIGVGTTSPTQKLDINGSLKIRTVSNGESTDSLLVISNGVVKKVKKGSLVSVKTGSYTLTAEDNGSVIIMNSLNPVNLSVPNTLPGGFVVQVIQKGDGEVTVLGNSIVLNSANGFKTRTKNSAIGIVMESSGIGYITGDSN